MHPNFSRYVFAAMFAVGSISVIASGLLILATTGHAGYDSEINELEWNIQRCEYTTGCDPSGFEERKEAYLDKADESRASKFNLAFHLAALAGACGVLTVAIRVAFPERKEE